MNCCLSVTRPVQTTRLTLASPTSSSQTCAVFAFKRVGNDLVIAHSCRCPCSRSIEETTRIPRTIGTEPSNLKGVTIIQKPAHWTACDHNADKIPSGLSADGEIMPDNRLVVTVMLPDIFIGLPQ